jgi:Mg-chelatase subunit ChlD
MRRWRPSGRGLARLAGAAGLAWAAWAPGLATAPGAAAAGPSAAYTYRLVDTWQSAPWALTAGRVGQAADVGSSPDGRLLYLLDSRHAAVHVFARDGSPLRVFALADPGALPGAGWSWLVRRMDAGPDGSLYVLWGAARQRTVYRVRVERLAPSGERLGVFERDGPYNDLAVGPDGLVYLARMYPVDPGEDGPGGVDVLDMAGQLVGAVGGDVLTMPSAVDVDSDGTVYVVNRIPVPAGNPPPPATPLPDGVGPAAVRPRQERAPEGVAVFAPDRSYRGTERFMGAEDVGVGPAGAFVSRTGEVFRLGEAEPLYSAPVGGFTGFWLGGSMLRLAVPPGGGLAASFNHCYHQGLVTFADPARRPAPARYHGRLDRPALEGPVFPLRVAAGADLAVLQGRFTMQGTRPDVTYRVVPQPQEPQVVQRWSLDGTLAGELGLCASARPGQDLSDVWWARDVAMDGTAAYTVDPELVHRRPGEGFPEWSYWPGQLAGADEASQLVAVAAAAGRVAVLDAGTRSVLVLSAQGALLARWSTADLGPGVLPGDVALTADQVIVADVARARVFVRTLSGAPVADWPALDGVTALAAGPEGDIYVLGRSGWAYRHRPDGTPLAAWRLTAGDREAQDIAVGPDGRVFVPFVERLGTRDASGFPSATLLSAGIWVFAPSPSEGVPEPTAGGCVAVPDKVATPAVLPLGADVTVQLRVTGRCPPRFQRLQAILAFDTSRSMNREEALARAKGGAQALLAELDSVAAEVGLVTFDDDATLEVPLTADLARVRARVAALDAYGDTRMRLGLAAARDALTGPRADPAARRVIFLVTDGNLHDAAQEAADQARTAGITVYVLAFPTSEFNDYLATALAQLTGDLQRTRLLVEPDRAALRQMLVVGDLVRPVNGLFEHVTVEDVIPANMRFVPGSDTPPATVAGATLRWQLPAVSAADGITLSYRLVPGEVGVWPTNVRADADYRDALGADGRLAFPVPRVRVWDRSQLTHRVYLPFAGARACFRTGQALDVVLAMDSSESMTEPAGPGVTKQDAARAAALRFVHLLQLPNDHVAVVGFNSKAWVPTGLTGDAAAIGAGLAGLTTARGTRLDLGLAAAATALAGGGRPEAHRVVILLTDGLQTGDGAPVLAAAERLRSGGTDIYAIGLGATVDAALLTAVGGGVPGHYYASPTPDDLAAIYRDIMADLACAGQ